MKNSNKQTNEPEANKATGQNSEDLKKQPELKSLNDNVPESLTKLMLDSTPLMCSIWDESGQLIDCNLELLRLLKIKNKSEIMIRFFDFSPQYQSDGKISKEKGMNLIKQALKTGHQNFEWEYQTSEGELLPTETSLIRVKWGGKFRILAYSRDLRELKKAKKQEKMAEERTSIMLNTLPLATFILSDKFKLIDCNEATVNLFKAKDKEHVINAFPDSFSPKYQPDGEPSSEKAREYLTKALEEGSVDFEWVHQTPDGELIPALVSIVRVSWHEQGFMLCAYAQDLREAKKAEHEIQQRAAYMKIVNKVAEWLLSATAKNAKEQIDKTMNFLAQNMNIDGIKVWMNTEQDGELYYRLCNSWPTESADKWTGNYAYNNLPFWKDTMLDNRSINGFVRDLPRAEQLQLTRYEKIKSILALPLLVENEPWGFISFEDRQRERVFTDSEEYMLTSVSSLIVSTIVRNIAINQMLKNNRELRKKSHLLSSVNRVAELILGSEKSDFPLVIQRTLKLLGESVVCNRASLWIIHYEDDDPSPRCKRLSGWNKGKAFSESRYSLDLKMYDYIPEWNIPVEDLQDIEVSVDEMNVNAKRMSILQGCRTLLLIPLTLQDQFWGFVGFGYEEGHHKTTEEERSILRAGSMMIAEALTRQKVTASLKEVEEKAAIDHLTGLLTRASFMQKAQITFSESQKNEKPYSVLFLDIDHFKKINDKHGHAFGDEVLVRFAEIIKNTTRPGDLCCRYGGEEVVIALTDGEVVTAEKVAQRISNEARLAKFESYIDFRFTVSIGLISEVPQKDDQLQAYFKKADLALYAAKHRGRDRVINYVELQEDLDPALNNPGSDNA